MCRCSTMKLLLYECEGLHDRIEKKDQSEIIKKRCMKMHRFFIISIQRSKKYHIIMTYMKRDEKESAIMVIFE